MAAEAPFVSVVIPVLHDAAELERLLDALRRQLPDGAGHEVLVVNGDAADSAMRPLQARFGAVRWTSAARGRARQMNAGAEQASGAWLLFLHADTCPAPGWLEALRRVDRDPRAVAGALRLTLRSRDWRARVVERGVAWRVRWLGLPYGDQGIFVRRAVFEQIGGYRLLPLMEDVDLVRRLRRRGRLVCSQVAIAASARRWERDGWARRTLLNLLLLAGYAAGLPPARLARAYYGPGGAATAGAGTRDSAPAAGDGGAIR